MATLVLSTVGTALGGPVGGAIGALIGQSFDQQLLAPASRGPRLGDLSVQSSSYGTQIPRIYGSMRVAGSVIWATDLTESEQTTGAKGQPDVTYSYSVSLAVALSSRPISGIGRIWADGQLMRGAAGDFKVPTTFRFYDGNEAQVLDPLIASIEGIDNTPAYRGIALAVFENLELATYGNRIPFMTFEILGDSAPPSVGAILSDASTGIITADTPHQVIGYAAYGRSTAAAVQPLVDSFDVVLFDDGSQLRGPASDGSTLIGSDELGSNGDGQKVATVSREYAGANAAPSTLRICYYDPDTDFQTGEARAAAGEPGTNEVEQELPAAISADDAKSLVQHKLAREWARRERLTLRLPPARAVAEPGSLIETEAAPGSLMIDKWTLDNFVTVIELRPAWEPRKMLAAQAGRIVAAPDVIQAPTSFAVIQMPGLASSRGGASIGIAASSPNRGWRARDLHVTIGAHSFAVRTAAKKSVLGRSLSKLRMGDDAVEIELIDHEQWLMSCDDAALADGVNVALLGDEVLQFGDATPLGDGRFRLGRLVRQNGAGEHVAGEVFCLLSAATIRTIPIAAELTGAPITITDRFGSSVSSEVREFSWKQTGAGTGPSRKCRANK